MIQARSNISQTVASSWFSLVITSACQLITIPIALDALNTTDFALYAVITQMLMAVMLAEFGVRSACARLLIDARSKGREAYDRMWVASSAVFCLQACVMLVIILCLAPFVGGLFQLDPPQIATARWIFISVGLINTVNYALSIFGTGLLAGQRLSQINFLTSVSSVFQLAFFWLAIKAGAGLWAYPIGMLASVLLNQFLIARKAFKHGLVGRINLSLFDWNEVKGVFHLGFDMFIAAIFSMVMGNSLLIFSGLLLKPDLTAVLAVNLKLISLMTNVLQRIPGSADPVLMKMISDEKDSQFRLWWTFVTKVTISFSLFGAGMFVIWNHIIVTEWTNKEMVLPVTAAILLALIPFRYLVHYQFVVSLTAFKEIRRVKLLMVWEVVLYSALAYGLGHRFGLNGLLAANLLSMFGGSLLGGIKWFAKLSGIPIRVQTDLLFRLVVPLATVFGVFAWLGHSYLNSGWMTSITISTIWGLSFAIIGYAIILDTRERHELTSMMIRMARRIR